MPMDIERLINTIETELRVAKSKRDQATAEVEIIINGATREGRAALSEDEQKRVDSLFADAAQAKADIVGIEAKLGNARKVETEEAETAAHVKRTYTDPAAERAKPAYDRVARVGSEARTYRKDTDRKGAQFIRDVAKQFLYRDLEAETRLSRHMAEERVERAEYMQRAAGTGAFTGLVVPQYLTDLYAPAVAALRPFADICNKHDLPPDGMTVNISRVTTASSVALQASENTAVSATDMDDTLLTENVLTAAGQQTLSRQALDRGTGIEEVVMNDLMRRYATSLDSTLLNQASTGLSAVATATTFADTTPTGPELYPKILGSAAGVEAALLAQAVPSHAVMHSRRWYWLSSQLTSQWPMINQGNYEAPGDQISEHTMGVSSGVGYNRGVRGRLPNGMAVVVDNNIAVNQGAGTNEDEIYIVPSDECHLWEDPNAPLFIRAEQAAAANLGVLLVLYGYFAYSFRRYVNGMGKIGGSGLVAPTF